MGRILVGCYSAVMRLLAALLLMPLFSILGFAVPAGADTLVRIEGKNFIAADGSTIDLKGISLGNWLMPEGYMFKFEVAKSPRQMRAKASSNAGARRSTSNAPLTGSTSNSWM